MSAHRREVQPRYGRIVALAVSVTVSAVAALAGLGVLASGTAAEAGAAPMSYARTTAPVVSPTPSPEPQSTGSPAAELSTDSAENRSHPDPSAQTAVPADSGVGRRIVFSQARQRVWLLGSGDHVKRTYLVSGSVTHNLHPGTYSVYSRSRWAVGVDDSGVMQYFVRFTRGPTGAAIGFHTIPTKNGVPQQTRAELGTPRSHGCIRQYLPDAVALWKFAPVGTKVVVVA